MANIPITSKRRGRPPDATIDVAILDATVRLLRTRRYDEVGMEAIADAAGVGRQTLYRRYACKQDVVLAALSAMGEEAITVRRTGSLEQDVAQFMRKTFVALKKVDAPLRALMAQAQMDKHSRNVLRDRFIAGRRAALRTVVETNALQAEPRDVELSIDAAFGIMCYRFLVEHAPLTPALARDLARLVAHIVGPAITGGGSKSVAPSRAPGAR